MQSEDVGHTVTLIAKRSADVNFAENGKETIVKENAWQIQISNLKVGAS